MGICNSIPIHESVRNEIIEIEHSTYLPDPFPIPKNMPKNTNSDKVFSRY